MLSADPLNLLIRLAYSYNRSALELFFYNAELYQLFMDSVPTLLARPYESSEGRRHPKSTEESDEIRS